MTVEEFVAWAETQERGRYELDDGQVIAMSPERADHVTIKMNAALALRGAIGRANLSCFAYVDGIAVMIDANTTFEPDAMVVCGERVPGNEAITSRPTIVVEVLSPATGYRDLGPKLDGYFKLPSVQHYLNVDPDERRIVHHRRGKGEALETRLFSEGAIRLDPPGLEIATEEIFAGLE